MLKSRIVNHIFNSNSLHIVPMNYNFSLQQRQIQFVARCMKLIMAIQIVNTSFQSIHRYVKANTVLKFFKKNLMALSILKLYRPFLKNSTTIKKNRKTPWFQRLNIGNFLYFIILLSVPIHFEKFDEDLIVNLLQSSLHEQIKLLDKDRTSCFHTPGWKKNII